MQYFADLHIHSRFSRGTSKYLTLSELDLWARLKGIAVVGTGDATHPAWLDELAEQLIPAEEGLYMLNPSFFAIPEDFAGIPWIDSVEPTRFAITAEISTIYSHETDDGKKVRKVHHLCIFSSLEKAKEFSKKLGKRGNITSDGRPIVGLSSRELLALALESDLDILFIPAHIWTPWFSVLGSRSGYNSIEACYGDLTPHIYAVETGLSSDPPMNWLCSFLDPFTLVSNSDAHSAKNIGREANILDTNLSLPAIRQAIKTKKGFLGTIEFFPEEGKYHHDGHRKCGISLTPVGTLKHNGLCPVCGKKLTIGVQNRVAQLADRDSLNPEEHPPYTSLIPLPELISHITGRGVATKTVNHKYITTLAALGAEYNILIKLPLENIEKHDPKLAKAIANLRNRKINSSAGYDGEYGKIIPGGDTTRTHLDFSPVELMKLKKK
ncbi:endonuclease Q family protein [Spirochaetia bacterium 38H-sp]|uniref:Endonuclease Q family protein n=1 Tax=Rarispira pelagica TaxID=3141764 RepID=A0ABU9UBL4_9SPIR